MKKTYPCFTGFMTRAIFCYVPEELAVTALGNEKQWDQPEKLVLRKDITVSENDMQICTTEEWELTFP